MILGKQHTAGFLATTAFLLVATASDLFKVADALMVGDTICTEGYVMDFFCINRGTLFDNPSVETLVNPGVHSIHCLVDVNSCVISPYEILLDPIEGGDGLYKRGWQLDDASKTQAIALAQSVGTCDTCAQGNVKLNSFVTGFRMAMTATILDLNDGESIPPTIQVQEIRDTTGYVLAENNLQSACDFYFGVKDVVDNEDTKAILEDIAAGVVAAKPGLSFRTIAFIHASLMCVAWGFLLPSGVLLAKFYKHRPDGLWYRLHRGIQTLGLILAVAAWIIALTNFNVFKDYGFRNYQHGILGMVVMILGILQPLNALVRPHGPESDIEAKSTKRFLWEIWHKGSGYAAVVLAVPTIVLGTLSLGLPADQKSFQMGYVIGCIGGLLLLMAYIFYDKKNFQQKKSEEESKKEKSPDEHEA